MENASTLTLGELVHLTRDTIALLHFSLCKKKLDLAFLYEVICLGKECNRYQNISITEPIPLVAKANLTLFFLISHGLLSPFILIPFLIFSRSFSYHLVSTSTSLCISTGDAMLAGHHRWFSQT